jgi:predicted transcriptional regulator
LDLDGVVRVAGENTLSKDDRELVQILMELGLKRPTATTLVYLGSAGKSSSTEVQTGTGLKQPEVSVAMKDLTARGWVETVKERSKGRGRSTQYSSLAIDGNQILTELTAANKEIIIQIRAKLDELKSLKGR